MNKNPPKGSIVTAPHTQGNTPKNAPRAILWAGNKTAPGVLDTHPGASTETEPIGRFR